MTKAIFVGLIALSVVSATAPLTAQAQQYVYPVYSQSGGAAFTPYANAYLQKNAQQQAAPAQNNYPVQNNYAQNQQAYAAYEPAPQYANPGNVIPLSNTPPSHQVSDYSGKTGYGTANYDNIAPSRAPSYDMRPSAAYEPAYEPMPTYAPAAPAANFEPVPTHPDFAPPPAVFLTGYNWTGCYLGGYGGGAFGGNANANEAASQGGINPAGRSYNLTASPYAYSIGDSAMGGGTLGCNFEIPQHYGPMTGFLLGVEGEGGYLNMSGKGTDPNSGGVNGDTHDKTRIGNWDAIAAGRIGLVFDRTLVYGKFGAVFTDENSSLTDSCTAYPCGSGTLNASGHASATDAAIGGGIEYALNNDWSIKGEYMYLDTGDSYQVCGAGGGSVTGSSYCSQHTLDGTHTIKVGLNYHFNDMFATNSSPRW